MIKYMFLLINLMIANLALAGNIHSTEAGISHNYSTRDTHPLHMEAERNIRDVGEVVKHVAREHIEIGTFRATEGRLPVTSRDRPGGALASPAHNRGAVDFGVQRSRDPHRDAQAIAYSLGPGHKVIVEHPGRFRDVHTSYSVIAPTGQLRVNTYYAPPRATATHIHVQPEYGVGYGGRGRMVRNGVR